MKSRPDTIFRTVTWPRLENRPATGSSIGRPAGVEGGLAILQLPASRASIPIPSFRGIPMRGCRIFSRSTRSFHWNETLALLNASEEEQERRVVQILMNRKIRDASFRRQVCQAYDNTCAITGLRMVNGGGKAEAQAAHIWSVATGGPDVVQNGLALSATVHWLFDRHLISLADDYGLLVSHNRVPEELRSLFDRQLQRIRLPKNRAIWPRPQYIQRHRAAFLG